MVILHFTFNFGFSTESIAKNNLLIKKIESEHICFFNF